MNSIAKSYSSPFRTDFGDYHLMNPGDESEVKVVDFKEENELGLFEISLYSCLFAISQLKIDIRGNKMVLLVSEQVESGRSRSVFVSDWQSYYPQSYTRMRTINLLLPGDNFFLLRHFLVPENYLLKVFLSRLADN